MNLIELVDPSEYLAVRQCPLQWLCWLQLFDETRRFRSKPSRRIHSASACQRKFEILLFWSLDRLSREGVLETLQHLNRLTSYGVAWRSYTELYLDSTGIFRDAVIGILAAVAKQERVRRSECTRAGLEKARARGKVLGRRRVQVNADAIRQLRAAGLSWGAIRTADRNFQIYVPASIGDRQFCGMTGNKPLREQLTQDKPKGDTGQLRPNRQILKKLVDTVGATGGLIEFEEGTFGCASDEDWLDLADAALAAARTLQNAGIHAPLRITRAVCEEN